RDHVGQDGFGLDGFELGLDEIGVVNTGHTPAGKFGDVGVGTVHLDARLAHVPFRQDEGDQGGGDDNQQKDREDHGLADADDAPVVEKVELVFLCRWCFQRVHNKKIGGLGVSPAPTCDMLGGQIVQYAAVTPIYTRLRS